MVTVAPRSARRRQTTEEVTDMTALHEFTATSVDEIYALWEQLRLEAISEADRHEIDAIFARQVP